MGRNAPMTISPAAKAELLRRIAALGDELDKAEAEHERVVLEHDRIYQENVRLREALRLACQDLRGPGVPTNDLVADYLRAAGTEREP
jgi:hypothetical protein